MQVKSTALHAYGAEERLTAVQNSDKQVESTEVATLIAEEPLSINFDYKKDCPSLAKWL